MHANLAAITIGIFSANYQHQKYNQVHHLTNYSGITIENKAGMAENCKQFILMSLWMEN